MSIVMDTNYGSNAYVTTAAESQKTTSASNANNEVKQAEENATQKQDSFEKSTQYKTDTDKVNALKADLANNVSAFRMMVQSLLNKQGGIANTALADILVIDKETQAAAQAAIAEDGYWGVEATANRMLDFAKALTGGDPAKIDAMRDAFQKGFEAAEKIWGGKLPDISYKTYDRVMQGFDEWANAGASVEEE